MLLMICLITISTVNAADIHMNSTNNTIANAVINETSNGDTIYLDEGTYTQSHLNGTDGITINKNLTVIGKNKENTIINAEQAGRIFNITEGNILTLINITLINGIADSGGAIYNGGGTAVINNCAFKNNNATNAGGAIYSTDGNLTVTKSNFNDNTAGSGGAIDIFGYLNLVNSTFTNNNAYGGGSIQYWGSNGGYIDNCNFINNTATSGGAIAAWYQPRLVFIKNSNFVNNSADYGGAIIKQVMEGNINIDNCNFTNNKATYNGGAIETTSAQYLLDNITNSNFEGNTAGEEGNAIYASRNNMTIFNCNFTENIGTGSTLFLGSNELLMEGCNIYNNSTGILIEDAGFSSLTINYNRIFNHSVYDLKNNERTDVNIDYNWWGNNNPDMTKILGITPSNYFVMNVLI